MTTKKLTMMFCALTLIACGSGKAGQNPGNSGQTSENANAVAISNFSFQPASITIPAGAAVTWTNQDEIPHTATSDAGAWGSPALSPGQTYTLQFNVPGTYTYHCNVHPGMKATVIVQ